MSNRRKSSTPCMVLVSGDLNKEQLANSERSESPAPDLPLENLDGLDQESKVEVQNAEEPTNTLSKQSDKSQPTSFQCKYCPFSTCNLTDFKQHVDSDHPSVILNPLYRCTLCNFDTNKFDSLTDHNETKHPGHRDFKFKRVLKDNNTVLEQTIATNPTQADQVTALNINGTVIIPDSNGIQGQDHVTPLLQRPPNVSTVPKVAIPLNTAKYNPSLDENLTLIASFNKFPYPTHAELSWLTAASKHPEEQIRIWFTTQRLKQGITWSPEEVEEARKKMFNGSIPPAHQTFSVSSTNSEAALSVKCPLSDRLDSKCLKRALPVSPPLGPDSKRPVMAVAPNPGDVKVFMAPPPPPPPKDRPSLAATVHSLAPKVKSMSSVGNKTKPVISMPSMVFPESLTRPMIAPLPIFAPPFKNSILIPRETSKEQHPALVPQQMIRPAVIQATLPKSQTVNIPRNKDNEGVNLKASVTRGILMPLADANGARVDAKRSTDVTSSSQKGEEAAAVMKPDFPPKPPVLTQFPLLERMKGKSAEHFKVLEENFVRNSFPTHNDVEKMVSTTRLSHQEITSWFVERRALRDNLELALLNSMGSKKRQDYQTQAFNRNASQGMVCRQSPPPIIKDSVLNNNSYCVSPENRFPTLLKEDFGRWPSHEEYSQPDARMGGMNVDISRWYDSRMEMFHNFGVNGGRALNHNGALTANNKVLEVELGWLMEQRANNLSDQQRDDLHRLPSRPRQQDGGVLVTWPEDGAWQRARELLPEREDKMAGEASARLTG
ncbi:zinc fingers and homeoboxes protein 2-like isoform 1-T1 [Synchiropus picturatus]